MRVVYAHPSYKQYKALLTEREKIRGGSLHDIDRFTSPISYQRGSGFFSTIASLVRRTLPFLRKTILPAASDMARNMAYDYSEGKDMRKSAKEHGMTSLGKVGKKIMAGGKRKKTGKVTKNRKSKKNQGRKLKTCHPPGIFQ